MFVIYVFCVSNKADFLNFFYTGIVQGYKHVFYFLQVRRAAAKCLESVITTRHELLVDMYQTVSPALIARFKGKPSF